MVAALIAMAAPVGGGAQANAAPVPRAPAEQNCADPG
jgi:hypothetical protein